MRRVIERNDLYERVWKVPMTRLAREFELSDNGLRKICKLLVVPTPPAGHWMKLQAGKPVERTPLPPAGARESYVLEASEKPSLTAGMRSPIPADLADRIAAEADDASRVVLPPAGKWHKALIPFRDRVLERVKEWRREEKIYEASLARRTTNKRREPNLDGFRWKMFLEEGGFIFPTHKAVAARVTLNTYERGLALLNALCFAADSRGFAVEATLDRFDSVRLVFDDIPIRLRILERTGFDVFHEDGTPSEHGSGTRRRAKPKGVLRIYCQVPYSGEKVLDEFPESPWEVRLHEVFLYIYRALARAKEKILGQQAAEEARRIAIARRDEEQRLQEMENQRHSSARADQMREEQARFERERALLGEAARWKQARDLRHYIEHIELEAQAGAGAEEWLAWARDVLKRLDPTPSRIESFQRDERG